MDDTVTIYEKSTCSKCSLAEEVLRQRGVKFNRVEYYQTPFTHAKLKELLQKMQMRPRELLRTKEKEYKELGLSEKDYSDDELIDLMISHPNLIERPIIEKGDRAVLARPVDMVDELL